MNHLQNSSIKYSSSNITDSPSATSLIEYAFQDRHIRAYEKNGTCWFATTDIAKALGYRDANRLTRMLDDDEADTHNVGIRSENGTEQTRAISVINESGLYHALINSRQPNAKPFRKWVTAEVIPAIRKHGQYTHPDFRPEQTRDVHRLGLSTEQQDQVKALHKQLVSAAPKEQQGKLAMKLWSSIKAKFGVSYKDVPPAELVSVISLMTRVAIEGEYLPKSDEPIFHVTATELAKLVDMELAKRPCLSRHQQESLANLLFYCEKMTEAWKQLEPVLRQLESPLAGRLLDRFKDWRFAQDTLTPLTRHHPTSLRHH